MRRLSQGELRARTEIEIVLKEFVKRTNKEWERTSAKLIFEVIGTLLTRHADLFSQRGRVKRVTGGRKHA